MRTKLEAVGHTPGPLPVAAHMTVHSLNGRKEAFAIVTREASDLPDGQYSLVVDRGYAGDLLDAAKEAVSLLEQTLTWREGWECSEDELLHDIRAAIAKAEGRAS